ncbi:hypothetical protein [Mucilaginibacter myungsuensis]|nr:hypothetical protein [Mucilaginibacter myungsuensis]MDN3598605.1 hypothetical protein [Mucilaginibacter myungsuensis]
MSSAAERQIAAHSRSSWMHLASIFTSSSFKHSVAQWLQATAQATHA